MHRKIRLVIVTAMTTLLLGAASLPALAAKPAQQACMGKTIAALAHNGAAFGAFVSGVASTTGGVGEEVQAIQAGAPLLDGSLCAG